MKLNYYDKEWEGEKSLNRKLAILKAVMKARSTRSIPRMPQSHWSIKQFLAALRRTCCSTSFFSLSQPCNRAEICENRLGEVIRKSITSLSTDFLSHSLRLCFRRKGKVLVAHFRSLLIDIVDLFSPWPDLMFMHVQRWKAKGGNSFNYFLMAKLSFQIDFLDVEWDSKHFCANGSDSMF